MNDSLLKSLLQISDDISEIYTLLCYSFTKINKIDYKLDTYFIEKFNNINKEKIKKIENIIGNTFNFDNLIKLFELIIPIDEKEINGVYFTPNNIKEYIVTEIVDTKETPFLVCDPSCGCGSFLYTIANAFHNKYSLCYKEIIENYLYGVDILEDNIEKAKGILKLLALTNNEVVDKFNLICKNSLDYNFNFDCNKPLKFDAVIGNPPYVRNKNIDLKSKKIVQKWDVSTTGNTDLYIPFYQLGIELLNKNGVLGYITPNTFFISINGRKLRDYMLNNTKSISIIDFKNNLVFENVMVYTCIVLLNLEDSKRINYSKSNPKYINNLEFNNYDFESFKDNTWRMSSINDDNNIKKIESFSRKLENLDIKNGIATLKNDLFIFKIEKEDNNYYYRTYNGKKYKIEKKICRDIVKPNILKLETDLINKREKIIFPYYYEKNKLTVIKDRELKKEFPETYKFFCDNKEILTNRDKGKKVYPEWYAFGRTQGLNTNYEKIFIPYLSDKCYSIISDEADLLFYCGYSIKIDGTINKLVLKKILESDVFTYYVKIVSKPYSGGFYSFAKSYIKKFSIPELSDNEIDYLIKENDNVKITNFLCSKYGIVLEGE